MTGRRIDPEDFDNAVHIYLSGKTLQQAATDAGMGVTTLTRELRRRGIETSRRGTWCALPAEEVIGKYVGGASEYALAKEYGVQRDAIRTLLGHHKVHIRDRSEAGLVRAAKMTPEQRASQLAAAHAANVGRKATWDERCRYAATREKRPPELSVHERPFAAWLAERDVPYRREVAVGPYNVDFAIGSVAVEVLGGEWHSYKARHASRTPYILDQGWALAFVWATINCPMTAAAADYVVAFANEVTRDPAVVGEYRVIRGDGYLITRGRGEDGEFTGITPARDSYDIAS